MKLAHSFSLTIHPIPPYSFELTRASLPGWPLFSRYEVWKDGTLWTALHIGGELTGCPHSPSSGTVEKPEGTGGGFPVSRPR